MHLKIETLIFRGVNSFHSHNSELLGAYGNLVNRTLKFIDKSFEGAISGNIDVDIVEMIQSRYGEIGP